MVVQATNLRHLDNVAETHRLDRPWLRGILFER